jgi:serine/threonine protein kinase
MLGRKLLHYEILEKLGEGGMGSVWKARDTHLGRLVAIKLLAAHNVADASRKHRFVQEAHAASALNHPNIVVIHDIATADGTDFIVMELVAGVTLDRRIPRSGMKLGELLDIAIQIADALAAAHAASIVHRDLKPANIMITGEGRVKLLDFGLAKLSEPVEGISEEDATRTARPNTEEGAILGTIAYMSPEQAEAKHVDARSDIFSFGAVLYELATGRRAFQGESKMQTLSAILRENPRPASEIAPGVPRDLDKIISRSLRKDPARRFQSAADLKVALAELREESESGPLEVVDQPKPRWRLAAVIGVGLLCVAAVVAGGYLMRSGRPMPPGIVLPLTSDGDAESPTFSPDGTQVAYQRNNDLYVKMVEGGTPLRLTSNHSSYGPKWSPDGRWIAFVGSVSSAPGLKSPGVFLISPIGGPPRKVVDLPSSGPPNLCDWMPDSQSLVADAAATSSQREGIYLFPIGAGERRRITTPPEGAVDFMPSISPDGRNLAFVRFTGRYDLYTVPLAGGETRRLTSDGRFIRGLVWVNNGEILFSSTRGGGRALWRVAADGRSAPQLVPGVPGEAMFPAISRAAKFPRLAYTSYASDYNIWRMEIALATNGEPHIITAPAQAIASKRNEHSPQFSPDGKRIAFESDRSGYREIWVASSDGENQIQLSNFRSSYTGSPRWSPDGQHIVFESFATGNGDVYMVGADGGAPQQLTTEPSFDSRPSWSQDRQWIYFRSNRSGSEQIWKIPAAKPYKPAVQITTKGGWEAAESIDGIRLYFTKSAGGLWSMPVNGGEESLVLDSVLPGYWALAGSGIYFVEELRRNLPAIQYLGLSSKKPAQIGKIERPLYRTAPGLAVTQDGRWIAWEQADREETDVMLLNNFR